MATAPILNTAQDQDIQTQTQNLNAALRAAGQDFDPPSGEQGGEQSVVPRLPETLDDTGLAGSVIEHLLLKLLYARGDMLGRELSEAMGLKFSLIEEFI